MSTHNSSPLVLRGDFGEVAADFSRELTALGLEHCIVGSVASSIYGMARATADIDFVADIPANQAVEFIDALAPIFHVDSDTVGSAIRARDSFNIIHRKHLIKVDCFPVTTLFDREVLRRSAIVDPGIPVSSPDDTLLAKLVWFRLGNEVSERQWADLLGLARSRDPEADWLPVERHADELGVLDLLRRLRDSA